MQSGTAEPAPTSKIKRPPMSRLYRLVVIWIGGSIALALVTAVCFKLGLNLGATGYIYLILIVLLSLLDSMISSLIFSIIAVVSLDFFFAEPRFTFALGNIQDTWRLGAFLTASVVISGLVRQLHRAREMQTRQTRLLDMTSDAVFALDMNDVIVYWNRGAEELYGWEREEAIGKIPHKLLQTQFPAPLADLREILTRTGHWDGELVHTTRDGATVHVASRWSLQRDDAGEPIGVLETNSDITERKRAEQSLAESERRFALLVQGVTDYAIYMLDPKGNIANWNVGGERIKGYRADEVVGRHFSMFYTPEDVAAGLPDRGLAAAARDGRFEKEGWRVRKDGTMFYASVVIDAIKGDDGTLLGFAKITRDITERRRAQELLRRSEAAYLNQAQQLSRTGSFGWNVATGEIFWSDETFRIFGYDRTIKPTVDLFRKRIHPDDRPRVQEVLERAAADRQAFDFEHRLLMPDGSVKTLHVVAHPLAGEANQFVGAVMDFTARKKAYEATERSEKRYQNLFRAMAISFAEIDWSQSAPIVRRLREAGVDIRRHLIDNPGTVRELLKATRVVDINDQSAALFAGNRESMLGDLAQFWPEESWPTYIDAIVSSVNREPHFSAETRMRRLDGTLFDAQVTIWNAADSRTQGFTAVYDISERKRAFADLERSQRRYQNLFRAMAISFWEVDWSQSAEILRRLRDSGVVDVGRHLRENPATLLEIMKATRIVDVNDMTVALIGPGSKQEMLGEASRFWPEESWPAYIDAIVSSINREPYFSAETQLRRLDGTVFDAQVTVWYSTENKTTGYMAATDISERKKAFADLERSEERYRNLFQHMPISLWQLDTRALIELFKKVKAEGVTDFPAYLDAHPEFIPHAYEILPANEVNEATLKMFGATDPSEVLGPVSKLWGIRPDTFRRAMESRFRGEPLFEEKTQVRTLQGRVIDVLLSVARLDAGITMVGIVDITELNRVQEDLAEAQRLSRTGSFRRNWATGEMFWSDETFRIYGYDPRTKPSTGLLRERVHPDDRERVRAIADSMTTDRQAIDFEHRLLMPDGSIKTVHVVAWHRPGAPEYVGSVMDVTARTEAYAELQRTEQRYRYLFHHMPVALMQLRTEGRVRRGRIMARLQSEGVTDFAPYLEQHPEFVRDALHGLTIEAANDGAVEMFGARDVGDLIAMTNAAIWRERPDTFRRILESRFRGERTYQEETRIATLDGRTIDVLFTISRPEQVDSDAGRILYGFTDITEMVRTREKVQNLQAEIAHAARVSVLGELVASIAHEVNQPLAAIAASGEAGVRWLDRPEPNIAEASALMRRITADSRRAGEIIARVRSMATGRPPQRVALPLNDLIDEALLFLRHELQSKRVSVALNLGPGLPDVLADRIQLQQVIVNLAINAVQAMEHSESARRILALQTAPSEDGKIACTVEDSGPGIAPAHVGRLFDSFFTTKDSGMGLGLAVSRSIIEDHGGELLAEKSSAYGGARFRFTLPGAHSSA